MDISDTTVIVEVSVPATDTTTSCAPPSTGSCVADVTSPDLHQVVRKNFHSNHNMNILCSIQNVCYDCLLQYLMCSIASSPFGRMTVQQILCNVVNSMSTVSCIP